MLVVTKYPEYMTRLKKIWEKWQSSQNGHGTLIEIERHRQRQRETHTEREKQTERDRTRRPETFFASIANLYINYWNSVENT